MFEKLVFIFFRFFFFYALSTWADMFLRIININVIIIIILLEA